jgi:T5SS/PEP-CTERM-associated repeat protein/autotransporter-associated beta strand protein
VGNFSIAAPSLSNLSDLSQSGGSVFNYAFRVFTPSATGNYTLGMTDANYDPVMILYSGLTSFPANPATGAIGLNDDGDWSLFSGRTPTPGTYDTVMPLLLDQPMTAGTNYLVAISTYNSGTTVQLPATFFLAGPGAAGLDGAPAAPPAPTSAIWNTGSGNWTTTSQWDANTPPVNGVAVEFAGSGGISINDFASGNLSAISGLTFTSNATGSYTIDGNGLAIDAGGIVNNSTSTQTVAIGVTLNGSQTFAASTANLIVSGNISGNASLTKAGNQTLTLTGNNTYTGETLVEAGTLAIASSGSLTGTSKILVGNFTSGNTMSVLGSVSTGNLTLSEHGGSDDNTLTVGGGSNPASLDVGNLINVGFAGEGNRLEILGNGNVTAASSWVGGYGSNNTLEVNGGKLNNTSSLVVGYFSDFNTANITSGGNATVGSVTIGRDAASVNSTVSSNNTLLVSGTGSALNTVGLIYLGQNGSSNSLVVENGGKVHSQNQNVAIGFNAGSNNNALTINGTGSHFTNNNTLYVGNAGSTNSLTVSNGGNLTTGNSRIGSEVTSSNNTATVSGAGSIWTNTGTLRVGSNGTSNSLAIANGGQVNSLGDMFLGYIAGSTNNLISVNGTGSKLVSANLTVGYGGSSNNLLVQNGGNLTLTQGLGIGYDAASANNTATVSGAGSILSAQNIQVGNGANNKLIVADSATISAANIALDGTNATLQIGTGGAAGNLSLSGSILTIGTVTGRSVIFNHTDAAYQFASAMSGDLALAQNGTGNTSLTANNSYTGGTTISAGTLSIGNGSTSGAITGNITNNAALVFNRSDSSTYSGSITGNGTLEKLGIGTTTLTSANSTFSGKVNVNAGTLQMGASLANASFTVNGGTLGGSNITLGDVVINSGGAIAPGNSPGTITTGNMTWNGGGSYKWELASVNGTAGTDWDLIRSSGSLTINATSGDRFTISLASFGNGTLAGVKKASWEIGNFTTGITGFDKNKFSLNSTSMTGSRGGYYVSLGGGNTTLLLNYKKTSAIWNTSSGDWTTLSQWDANTPPTEGDAVEFSGSGGISTNNFASGNLSEISGLTFTSSANGSYTINGNALTLGADGIVNDSNSTQTVAIGLTLNASQTFAANTANLIVSGSISGNASLTKAGNQTLTLSGSNSYTGGTTISAGTLALGGTAGSVSGNIAVNAGATFAVNRTNDFTLGNLISGSGSFAHTGTGTTNMTAFNTYTGGTTISSGTVWTQNTRALGNGSVTLNGRTLLTTSSQEAVMGNQTLSIGGNLNWTEGKIAFYDTGKSPESGNLTIRVGGNFNAAAGNQTKIFDFSGVEALNSGDYTLVTTGGLVDATGINFAAVHGPYTTLFGNFTTTSNTVIYTVTGAVSGGSDIQNNGGPNTPVVANFYVTGATVTIGKTNIVNALTFFNSAPLTIQSNGTLTVTSGTLAVQTGASVVSGGGLETQGNLNKTGSGELDLQSNTNVAGIANVVEGLLSVNGQLNANSVVVNPTAILGGAGVIAAQNVIVNGNLSPGNSPGTLGVVGNLVLTGANSTIIEIASPTNFDRILVTGTATLGGTLNAVGLRRWNNHAWGAI